MKNELRKLTNKVVKLHECAKLGKNRTAYNLFKEAMNSLMELEANGMKSGNTEKIKAILAEYYNKYQATVKKDPTRVIVENKAEEAAAKAEEKAKKEEKKQLKTYHKELTHNVTRLKEAILSHNWADISHYAKQINLISNKITTMGQFYLSDTGDDGGYME